jgi:Rrf2 family iron-sulfur cluster assembly transcriptional regulator
MLLSRKGLLAIAAVVDVALQEDGRPLSSKQLAERHSLPPRHLESLLQALAREGILKGTRGPHGGYRLVRELDGVTAQDILRAAEATQVPEEQPKSPLVTDAVLPILSAVEEECGQALSRISLDDIVNRATKNGGGIRRDKPSEHPAA